MVVHVMLIRVQRYCTLQLTVTSSTTGRDKFVTYAMDPRKFDWKYGFQGLRIGTQQCSNHSTPFCKYYDIYYPIAIYRHERCNISSVHL